MIGWVGEGGRIDGDWGKGAEVGGGGGGWWWDLEGR